MPLHRLEVALLASTAAAAAVSIFAAQVGLAFVGLVHAARSIRRETRGFGLPVDASVAAFTIWTFLSSAFAATPVASQENGKKILLFLILYFGAECLRSTEDRDVALDGLLTGCLALAALAILQFLFLGYDTLDARPRSFLGHYMTASGAIMIGFLAALVRLGPFARPPRAWSAPGPKEWRDLGLLGVCVVAAGLARRYDIAPTEIERASILGVTAIAGWRAWKRPRARAFSDLLGAALVPLGAIALLASRTRSAWLGVVAGVAVLAALRRPRALLLLPAALGVLLLASPRAVVERLTLQDASSRDRYYMWQAGLDMILDKPLFGQGTGMILDVYPRFRWEGAPNPEAPHLHNNFIQIAAERGLPCLLFFSWFLWIVLREAWRGRDGEPPGERPGALSLVVLSATLVAGLFEYNLGDSEILIIVLLIAALPFAARASEPDPVAVLNEQ